MTDRKRVCCNCGRNKRIEDDTGEIRCYCELDNHYIDYVENFEHWCRRWTKEREWENGGAKMKGERNVR